MKRKRKKLKGQPWPCPKCGKVCHSISGATRHRLHAHGEAVRIAGLLAR